MICMKINKDVIGLHILSYPQSIAWLWITQPHKYKIIVLLVSRMFMGSLCEFVPQNLWSSGWPLALQCIGTT